MWTNKEWVDVRVSVMDGVLTINYKGHEVIKHVLPAAWEPLVGPNWLFAARTGGANETHWIDDLSIKLYASTVPLVSGFEVNAAGFDIQVTDIEEAGVELDTVKVTLDGEVVETANSKADGVTNIGYVPTEIFGSGSNHTLKVNYTDSNGKQQLLNLDFPVAPYDIIDAGSMADASQKGDSGFLVYATQISTGQGVGNVHGNSWVLAEKQINGGFIDPDTEEQYLNEADIDSFEGWSYYPEIVQTVNQNQDATGGVGNGKVTEKGNKAEREDEQQTGVQGWGEHGDGVIGPCALIIRRKLVGIAIRLAVGLGRFPPRVLIVVAVDAKELPVAAVGGVVAVIVVLVVDGKLAELLAAELTRAARAHPGQNLEGSLAVVHRLKRCCLQLWPSAYTSATRRRVAWCLPERSTPHSNGSPAAAL